MVSFIIYLLNIVFQGLLRVCLALPIRNVIILCLILRFFKAKANL